MHISDSLENLGRRAFLYSVSALAVSSIALDAGKSDAAERKNGGGNTFRGLFPIAWTPCTPDNKIDFDGMAGQVKFCNRGAVAGLAWPQIASGWASLSDRERLDGAGALLSAAKGGKTAIMIGVQTNGTDVASSVRYAKHAADNGAHAIISLPPEAADDQAIIDYFKAIGRATDLPLMVQAVGDMKVELVVKIAEQVPTLKGVKDEAGNPLERILEFQKLAANRLAIFSGNGGHTMLEEMQLGFAGSCPYVGIADLYQLTYNLWHQGKRRQAFDMFGRISAFNSIPGANEYVMIARGVFKDGTTYRHNPMKIASKARASDTQLDAAQKRFIREAIDDYLKPYLIS